MKFAVVKQTYFGLLAATFLSVYYANLDAAGKKKFLEANPNWASPVGTINLTEGLLFAARVAIQSGYTYLDTVMAYLAGTGLMPSNNLIAVEGSSFVHYLATPCGAVEPVLFVKPRGCDAATHACLAHAVIYGPKNTFRLKNAFVMVITVDTVTGAVVETCVLNLVNKHSSNKTARSLGVYQKLTKSHYNQIVAEAQQVAEVAEAQQIAEAAEDQLVAEAQLFVNDLLALQPADDGDLHPEIWMDE
eukprot:TRINITY_DN1404_c0_g1_i4.p1 TRINITY_DN1404_c0_g1~~TRINITY_DN1404_c0_g1_i4.p1  ORF type:complete len:246 (+),score=46.47 TRINITY_DN1404_c0_g1_i4:67-804(+)